MDLKEDYSIILKIIMAAVAGVLLYFIFIKVSSINLPILSEKVKLENGETEYKKISEVVGYDQLGNEFNTQQLKGKVHVANFFFASCPVVCPKMTEETKEVWKAFENQKEHINFVSYSIDPKRDTIERLYNFAERFGLENTNWYFVNVGKENVYMLARSDYKITAIQANEGKSDYIHSQLLALVDKDLLIRGYYDSTDPKEIKQLIKDIKKIIK
ncbi:MAG: SCO family protein [Bacteroidetes bacterium]|nr:SCO family protein [Bacteroidota bacterium]MCB9226830.1 SCO family protein [Chitinophagales bacterium]